MHTSKMLHRPGIEARAARVAGEHSTTEPSMLDQLPLSQYRIMSLFFYLQEINVCKKVNTNAMAKN